MVWQTTDRLAASGRDDAETRNMFSSSCSKLLRGLRDGVEPPAVRMRVPPSKDLVPVLSITLKVDEAPGDCASSNALPEDFLR